MKTANDHTLDELLNSTSGPVLVDFSAAWCGPCKVQKPVLEKFEREHPDVNVVLVDVDESPRVTNTYGIQAMPTLVLFEGGERKATALGLQSAQKLEALLARASA